MTLTDLCEKLRNWFDVSRHFGSFKIENGTIDLDYLSEGQFFRIVGSKKNDGVYLYANNKLNYVTSAERVTQGIEYKGVPAVDEIFKGAIWELAIPKNLILTYVDMCQWEAENEKAINSPYSSESFGGYSYSKESGANGENLGWQSHFRNVLARWQKI